MQPSEEQILTELAESLSPQMNSSHYDVVCDAASGVCKAKLQVSVSRAYPISRELLGGSFAHLASRSVRVGSEEAPYFGFGIVPEIREINRRERTVDFVVSTEAEDRLGDVIEQKGWLLKNYRKNPVHLFVHDSRSLPIGKALTTDVENSKLVQRIQYIPVRGFDLPDVIFQLIDQGVLKGISVGFLPIEFSFREEGGSSRGRRFIRQELLETSTVPIPANPQALVSRKSFSIGEALGSLGGTYETSAEEIWRELVNYVESQGDPEVDAAVRGILRGEERHVLALCEAVIPHLEKESMSVRCSLAADLRTGGRKRMRGLAEILVRRRGTEEGQRIARALFHSVKCEECSVEQRQTRCRCCKRWLCNRCAEIDSTTEMILAELARAS